MSKAIDAPLALPDGWPREFTYDSKTTKGRWYVTRIYPDGNGYCNCPGFGYRLDCSHIKDAYKKVFGTDRPVPADPEVIDVDGPKPDRVVLPAYDLGAILSIED